MEVENSVNYNTPKLVRKVEHFTHKKRSPREGEVNEGEQLVETSGYRSAARQIEDKMNAGERLSEFRKARYDFEDGKPLDFDFIDPTRRLDYDLADSTMDMLALEFKWQQAQLSKQESKNDENQNEEEETVPGNQATEAVPGSEKNTETPD